MSGRDKGRFAGERNARRMLATVRDAGR